MTPFEYGSPSSPLTTIVSGMRPGRLRQAAAVAATFARVGAIGTWRVVVLVFAVTAVVVVVLLATRGDSDDESAGAEKAALAGSGRAEVWAVGDGADGGKRAKALARRIAARRPDRLLYLGDVYEHGSREEFRRNYAPVYGSLASR